MDGVRRGTKVPLYGLKETFGLVAPDGSNRSIVAEGYRHQTIARDILYLLIEIIPEFFIRHYKDAVESNS